jgi:adenine-specific DNA-methyltransferase
VVGNPPYVGQKGNSELFVPFQKIYPEFYDRKQDLYYYFIYKGLSLLNKNGYISYIFPPYFLTVTSAINLRKEILNNQIKNLLEIKANVFESASIHSLIFLLKKNKINDNNFNIYKLEKEITLLNSYNQNILDNNNWYILRKQNDIEIKVECKMLGGEIAKISPGIQTGFDKAYIMQKRRIIKI